MPHIPNSAEAHDGHMDPPIPRTSVAHRDTKQIDWQGKDENIPLGPSPTPYENEAQDKSLRMNERLVLSGLVWPPTGLCSEMERVRMMDDCRRLVEYVNRKECHCDSLTRFFTIYKYGLGCPSLSARSKMTIYIYLASCHEIRNLDPVTEHKWDAIDFAMRQQSTS